ncbi:MAG: hypothetical protein B7Z08_06350 [Sphingomonadales bacterium 32-68-7]|nr:MAG: hypothetical protein B7Z33_12200 [Sphingomonadales bacterium 12-68-11]OYX09151.1 MAG: hypothetical protein B7Z08_06350 [Sphingomonadales bacterium 32-68-7]
MVPGTYPDATYVTPVAGQTRIFITESTGEIRLVDPATVDAALYLTVSDLHADKANGEHGLLTIAPAPDFAASGILYVYAMNAAGGLEIRRYGRLNATTGDPASMQVVLNIPAKAPSAAAAPELDGGWIGFGPDGHLYIMTSAGTPPANTSLAPPVSGDLTSLLGKVLRIAVSRDDFPADSSRNYAIPARNPFAASATSANEVWAYGFIRPRRASLTATT